MAHLDKYKLLSDRKHAFRTTLYLNDIENYLMYNSTAGINVDSQNIDLPIYLILLVLLYADDTVILCSNAEVLQCTRDKFDEYCATWNLKVNIEKTKILISGARKTTQFR